MTFSSINEFKDLISSGNNEEQPTQRLSRTFITHSMFFFLRLSQRKDGEPKMGEVSCGRTARTPEADGCTAATCTFMTSTDAPFMSV